MTISVSVLMKDDKLELYYKDSIEKEPPKICNGERPSSSVDTDQQDVRMEVSRLGTSKNPLDATIDQKY